MNRILLIISALSLVFNSSVAQTPVLVAPGDGTLEQAMLAADSNDILQLKGGGVYTLSSGASSFGKIRMPITIEVEPGSGEKAILQLGNDASLTKKYYFFIVDSGAALTLRGLEIHGLLNDTAYDASMVLFDARPEPGKGRIGNFRFENCIFHDFTNNVVHGMKDDYARGLIQDSVFIDNVIVYNSKHFLQYKHVSLKHLEMTNSTIYDLNGMALKIGKIGYRSVLENSIPVTDETITPTGFIDHCTLDDQGDIHGHIQVDDAFHMLTISNCILSNQQKYDQPPVYFTDPQSDTVVTIKNTCFWKVGAPNSDVGGTNWKGYVFLDSIYKDPEYLDAANSDFSIPYGSELLSFATDGGPIGDPRWTETAVGMDHFEAVDPDPFMLRNSPNPFSQSTNISFHLNQPTQVGIFIYNMEGRLVANLLDQKMEAGDHTLNWNRVGLENGVYLCRMQSGRHVSVRKLIIVN